jgi:hypothetical protein
MRALTSISWLSIPVLLLVVGCGGSSPGATGSADAGASDATHPVEAGADGGDARAPAEGGSPSGDAAMEADADNGAPSSMYPAPHSPLPQLTNADKGPVLTTPNVHLVFYPGYPMETGVQTFAQGMTQSSFWSTTTAEYGVGSIGYAGTITLTGQTAPQTITSSAIQSWVASEIQSGAFGTPDPQGIYTIVYPMGTTVTQPNPVSSLLGVVQSCVAFGGYHDNAMVAAADGGAAQNYAYAVIPTCSSAIDDLTAVMSHEWVEASTDPFLTATGAFTLMGGPDSAYFTVDTNHAIWALLGGGEAADLCEPEAPDVYITPMDLGFTVQRTWSNAAAMGSHDPCVPELQGQPFFDSAPVLNEMVTFSSSLTGSIDSLGVTIPVNGSKTIEVDLFSDGDTGGPWTVQADDVLYKYYGSYGVPQSLSFQWDRTQGVNGEKLHLTITVTQASIVGNGHAFMITSTLGTRVSVWPGLIVE